MLKIPTRLAITLGTVLSALAAYSLEIHVSGEAHKAIIFGLGIIGALFVHPGEAGAVPMPVAAADAAGDRIPPVPQAVTEDQAI